MQNSPSYLWRTASPHPQRDASVIECHRRLLINLNYGEEIPFSPDVVALTGDESRRRLSSLRLELRLLETNPTDLGCCVGTCDLGPRRSWGDKRDPTVWGMNGEVDVLHALARELYHDVSELEHVRHQYAG